MHSREVCSSINNVSPAMKCVKSALKIKTQDGESGRLSFIKAASSQHKALVNAY